MVVAFDFSKSNTWTGEKTYQGRSMHDTSFVNPYMRVLNVLEPIIPKFDDDNIYPAFRFGCQDTRDISVLPLLAPFCTDPHFKGFDALRSAYQQAVQTVKLAGPTTFAPIIRKTIEIEKAYGGK